MVLRVISKALESNPRNIKAICLYVCASMRDGFICLSIFYHLPVYLSPRHLSSTIYQSVLVLYLLSGSSISRCHRLLRTSSLAGLGEGVEQAPCLSRMPLVPSTLCSTPFAWKRNSSQLARPHSNSNMQGVRRLPGTVKTGWHAARQRLSASAPSSTSINIPPSATKG